MSNISFDNPWLLLLAIPLLAAVIVPFAVAIRKENRSSRNVFALVCNILIVICATLAIAGTSYKASVTKTEVYVLADVSYSTQKKLDLVDGYISEVEKSLPDNSRIAVMAFGRDCKVIRDFGDKPVSVKTADVDTSATDITNAVRHAGNLFSDNVIKRIVIITDGGTTAGKEKLTSAIGSLNEDGVYIDAVFIDSNLDDEANEIQVSGAEYSDCVFVDREETARISINSSRSAPTRVYVDLDDGSVKKTFTKTLYKGVNVAEVPLRTDEIGTYEYTVSVRTEEGEDSSPYNNSCIFRQKVTDRMKVLYIGGNMLDCLGGNRIYGTEEDVTYIGNADEIPFTVEELSVYDEIVLSNFDVRESVNAGQFLQSLDILVSRFGKTLTTLGNTYIQEAVAIPDDNLKDLAGMLPVVIGNRDKDARLITILLDVSYSMKSWGRWDVVSSVMEAFINSLSASDTVMVLGYSGDYKFVKEASSLRNKQALIEAIKNYKLRNGTELIPAMNYAFKEINNLGHHYRDLIIVSDGLSVDKKADCVALAEKMSASNIVISAIGVYLDEATKARSFLAELVENKNASGKGFYKELNKESEVNFMLSDITEEEAETMIEGEAYSVGIKRAQELPSGIDSLPPIYGFWYNSEKSGATVVLTAKYYRDKTTSFDVPIYAYWSYGNGKVFSFLSDVSWTSNWTDGWDTDDGEKVLASIKRRALPDKHVETPFVISTDRDGSTTKITASVGEFKNSATLSVVMTDPNGVEKKQYLAFDSENYVCDFETADEGIYTLRFEYFDGVDRIEDTKYFAVSYLEEYNAFKTYSVASLYRLLSDNGELSLDGKLAMDNSSSDTREYTVYFKVPLLIACVALFVVQIVFRMIAKKDIVTLFRKKKEDK